MVWQGSTHEVLESDIVEDFMRPRAGTRRRPAIRNLPSWIRGLPLIPPTRLPNIGVPLTSVCQPWFAASPDTILVQYDQSTVQLRRFRPAWYEIQNKQPHWQALIAGYDTLEPFAETIGGHTVALAGNGGLGIFMRAVGFTGEGEARFHRIFTSIQRRDTPTQCPFVCSLSGTIGYAGSWGDIYIFHQK